MPLNYQMEMEEREEYQKVYSHLRGRKNRRISSVDEWNRQAAETQVLTGKVCGEELQRRFEAM